MLVPLPAYTARSLDSVFQPTYDNDHAEKGGRCARVPLSAYNPLGSAEQLERSAENMSDL
jgi:hypothetical protein